jgi:predicted  nucleic acid-binding Zn-ribbon protein
LKNINYLRDALSRLDELGREELSAVTKDIGNKIIFMYDNLAASINDQRCMNLHLQMEIANLTKEKNSLRHEIKNLSVSVKKMETQLGVDPDPKFDNLITQNIFN